MEKELRELDFVNSQIESQEMVKFSPIMQDLMKLKAEVDQMHS